MRQDMESFRGENILSDEEFEALHQEAFSNATRLFEQLLFGLSQVYIPGLKEVQVTNISLTFLPV